MGRRDQGREELKRLASKTLEARFIRELREGLNCSRFEPAGKAVADCETRPVSLTVHRGADDDALLQKQGPAAFRRFRLLELCQEALSQGGLLTREDLAYRILSVKSSPRCGTRR